MSYKIPEYVVYTQDSYPVLEFIINKADGSGVMDLGDVGDITCVIRLEGSSSLKQSGICSKTHASSGICTYSLTPPITIPGTYMGQLVMVHAGSGEQRTSKFRLRAEEGESSTATS